MSDTIFRTKEEVETSTPKEEQIKETLADHVTWGNSTPDVDAPIALYQELKGYPYTAEYFEVKPIWNSPDIDLRNEVESIENAYRQKVQFNELRDGKDTYRAFIKEAEKATDTKDSPPIIKIAKIAEWVGFMARMAKIDKERVEYAH